MNLKDLELTPGQLTKVYKSKILNSKKTSKKNIETLIGQQKARRALEFGLGNKTNGFNIFVSGAPGLGKKRSVEVFLQKIAASEELPYDWCYVNNFDNFYSPNYLKLPKGQGKLFRKEIKTFLLDLKIELNRKMSSKGYQSAREELLKDLIKQEEKILKPLKNKAKKENFIVENYESKINVLPEKDGRALTNEEFLGLDQNEKKRLQLKQEDFRFELTIVAGKLEELQLKYHEKAFHQEQKYGENVIVLTLKKLNQKYKDEKDILDYLLKLKLDILENLQEFISISKNLFPVQQDQFVENEEILYSRYDVNVIVDHSNSKAAPIVFEQNPTYQNLFGKVERESLNGALITNFTLIREGALHRANGGYLLLPVEELLKNHFAWKSLLRALKNNEIQIEELSDQFGFLSTRSLKPEAIPLNVQIILFGESIYYQLLIRNDPDFKKYFKVLAAFDTTMVANAENINDFINQIENKALEENLLPLDQNGKLRLLTISHRLASNQNRLSGRLEEIMDIYREAHHYAKGSPCDCIDNVLLEKAIDEIRQRSNLYQEKIQEMVALNEILIELDGFEIGQINGLAVVGNNDTYFGRPNCITANVSKGKSQIIDIEREVNLGGPIHSKGVLIIKGFLSELFGQNKALNLIVHLAFEQSYSEIEGDSASSAELFAILSGLSQVPLNQGIAVTGSVNQKGFMQAVGGINEKIEGYFEICLAEGLTGSQGVIIPTANVKHLVLGKNLINKVKEKKFHIWAISHVEEGIELLTGLKAGNKSINQINGKVSFEVDSVFYKANQRLNMFAIKDEASTTVKSKTQMTKSYLENGEMSR